MRSFSKQNKLGKNAVEIYYYPILARPDVLSVRYKLL